MVTPAYIAGLRDQAELWQPIDADAIEQRLVAYLDGQLPDWSPLADSLLRRALPLIAEQMQVFDEERLAQARRGLLAYAEGADLDLLGLGPPVVLRRTGEADETYRVRIAEARLSLSLGSLAYEEALAVSVLPAITDALAVVARNRQDVTLYALTGVRQALSTTQEQLLTRRLNARDAVIAGVEVTVGEPTEVPYTIAVEATYDAGLTDGGDLSRRIRQSIYDYLAGSQRIGQPVYRSAIQEAAFVAGVYDLAISTPERDLAPPTVTIVPAASDPGAGAAGYADVAPAGATGRGLIVAIVLTREGSGYGAAPTARVHDDVGQTVDFATSLTGDRVTGVTIPHPQTLLWYAYPTATWGPVYTCGADDVDVQVTVTPIITPLSGRVSLTEEPAEVVITRRAEVVVEGEPAIFDIALQGIHRTAIDVSIEIVATGPSYGVAGGTRTVTVSPGATAELSVPTARQSVWQTPGTVTATAVRDLNYAAGDPPATAAIGINTSRLLDVTARPALDGESVDLGEDAVWTLELEGPAGAVVRTDVYYVISQSPPGVIGDVDDLGVHRVEMYLPSQRPHPTVGLPVRDHDYVQVAVPTLAADAGGTTGTLTLLLQSIGVAPTEATGRYAISGHPQAVTAQTPQPG